MGFIEFNRRIFKRIIALPSKIWHMITNSSGVVNLTTWLVDACGNLVVYVILSGVIAVLGIRRYIDRCNWFPNINQTLVDKIFEDPPARPTSSRSPQPPEEEEGTEEKVFVPRYKICSHYCPLFTVKNHD